MMEKEKYARFRQMLMEWKKRITTDYEKALDSNAEELGLEMPDITDEAARTNSQRILMSIGDKSLDTLKKIENALARIENGEYGQCAECGAEIPLGRLELLPHAELCVACQERLEKS